MSLFSNSKIFKKMTNSLESIRTPMKNFWHTLEKPIFILAPMEDVTDTVLRQVIARCGKPAVFFTEFTNVEGMFSKGAAFVNQRLRYTEAERPLVAQIWGTRPENFFK